MGQSVFGQTSVKMEQRLTVAKASMPIYAYFWHESTCGGGGDVFGGNMSHHMAIIPAKKEGDG